MEGDPPSFPLLRPPSLPHCRLVSSARDRPRIASSSKTPRLPSGSGERALKSFLGCRIQCNSFAIQTAARYRIAAAATCCTFLRGRGRNSSQSARMSRCCARVHSLHRLVLVPGSVVPSSSLIIFYFAGVRYCNSWFGAGFAGGRIWGLGCDETITLF